MPCTPDEITHVVAVLGPEVSPEPEFDSCQKPKLPKGNRTIGFSSEDTARRARSESGVVTRVLVVLRVCPAAFRDVTVLGAGSAVRISYRQVSLMADMTKNGFLLTRSPRAAGFRRFVLPRFTLDRTLFNTATARSHQAVCRCPSIRLPGDAIRVPLLRGAAQAARGACRSPCWIRLSA